MARFGVISSTATSLYTVATDIAYVLNKKGHEATVYTTFPSSYDAKELFDKSILVMAYDPLYVRPYIILAKDYSRRGINSVMYVTTEGVPNKYMIEPWMRTGVTYIAVSKYVEAMLRNINVAVSKVIYHGLNYDTINYVSTHVNSKKVALKSKFNAKVVFGTVASNHPRKNLSGLASVLRQVSEKLPNALFYIVTTPEGVHHFSGIPNVYATPTFGKLMREDILSLIGSFDFLVHSALTEGFGLPLLEAQAFGVPVIYPYYAPLTEITHDDANFKVEVSEVGANNFGDGINYTLHYFDAKSMAEQIQNAYDIFLNKKSEYEDRSEKVKNFAKQFDAEKVYNEFLEVLK
ncbi:MAG: glycosyltransferase [Thermoproteota archaeon]